MEDLLQEYMKTHNLIAEEIRSFKSRVKRLSSYHIFYNEKFVFLNV